MNATVVSPSRINSKSYRKSMSSAAIIGQASISNPTWSDWSDCWLFSTNVVLSVGGLSYVASTSQLQAIANKLGVSTASIVTLAYLDLIGGKLRIPVEISLIGNATTEGQTIKKALTEGDSVGNAAIAGQFIKRALAGGSSVGNAVIEGLFIKRVLTEGNAIGNAAAEGQFIKRALTTVDIQNQFTVNSMSFKLQATDAFITAEGVLLSSGLTIRRSTADSIGDATVLCFAFNIIRARKHVTIAAIAKYACIRAAIVVPPLCVKHIARDIKPKVMKVSTQAKALKGGIKITKYN